MSFGCRGLGFGLWIRYQSSDTSHLSLSSADGTLTNCWTVERRMDKGEDVDFDFEDIDIYSDCDCHLEHHPYILILILRLWMISTRTMFRMLEQRRSSRRVEDSYPLVRKYDADDHLNLSLASAH